MMTQITTYPLGTVLEDHLAGSAIAQLLISNAERDGVVSPGCVRRSRVPIATAAYIAAQRESDIRTQWIPVKAT
jgi:hypothetical protein